MRPVPLPLVVLILRTAFSAPSAHAEPLPPPDLAPDGAALAAAVPAARIEGLPGGFVLVTPPPDRPAAALDRHYRWRFERAVFVYAPRGGGRPGLARVVTVHHGPEDADAARRTSRLCARLLRLHRERFGRDATFPRGAAESDVWLARSARPGEGAGHAPGVGGETRDNQVYVFATGAPRSAVEWVRTLAHEWGHLTLPAARGFSAPEGDASGFLGERLYLKWLRAEMLAGKTPAPEDGTESAGLNQYHARQIAPLIARFQAAGPGSPKLDGRDAGAMDLYVGAALAADEALGSALLGRGVFSVMDVRPRGLLAALRTAVARSVVVPVRLPAWVPFQGATYSVAPAEPGARGALALADRPPLPLRGGTTELRIRQPGWKWVRTASGDVRAITLRRVNQGAPRS